MSDSETSFQPTLSKELLVGRIEKGRRLAQIVVAIKNGAGAITRVNALVASLGVDVRQSTSYSAAEDSLAIYNAFVVLNDPKVSLVQLVEKIEQSPHVVRVQAQEGRDGVIVDGISFPVNWQGRRTVILSQPATARMFEAIRSTFGSGGEVVLYQQGSSYGSELGAFFVARLGRDYLRHNFDYALGLLAATGWGVPGLVGSRDGFPEATVALESCLECDGVRGEREECSFVRGVLTGVSGAIAGHTVHCEESQCVARGDARCVLELRSGRGSISR